MKNITLTINGTGREVMVNWDSVHFAKETKSPYGDDYVEIFFSNEHIDVKETLQEIKEKVRTEKGVGIFK